MFAADLRHASQSLQEKLHALYNLSPYKKIAPGFRPQYLELLEAFGNPHKKLPPTIHIAGTNGKGSTLAMLRSVLEAAGYKVHAYTSPHLMEFNERIYLAGKNIDDAALENLMDRAIALNAGKDVTFFEITTAMAFAAFAQTPADIFLCETGLGGRLDCTNVIENPLATVITTISYDHQEFLGPTLQQIAAEKSGIMKPGAPCIVATQEHAEALNELRSKNPQIIAADIAPPVTPNLIGAHQIENARTALTLLNTIKNQFPVSEQNIKHGLQNIHWPARLQKMNYAPAELWYDGGHNESAAKILSAQIEKWQDKPLHIIIGMKSDKDADAFLKHLAPFATSVTWVDIPDMPSIQKGANTTISAALPSKTGRILVCGSLYLAQPLAKALT